MKTKTRSFFNVIKDENKRKKWILSHVTMLHVKCFFWGVGVKIYLHKHCQPVRSQARMAWLEMEKVFFSKGPGTFVWKTSWVYISSQSARLIVWFSAFFLLFLFVFFTSFFIPFPFVSPSVSSNSDCYFVLLVLPFFFCLLMCLRACLAKVMLLSVWFFFDYLTFFCHFVLCVFVLILLLSSFLFL